jgi:hypothetical protein
MRLTAEQNPHSDQEQYIEGNAFAHRKISKVDQFFPVDLINV